MLPFPPSGSQPKAEVSGVDEQKEETEGTTDLLQQHAPGSKDSPTISSVEKQVVKPFYRQRIDEMMASCEGDVPVIHKKDLSKEDFEAR